MIIDDGADQVQLMRTVFRMVDPSLQIIAANDGEAAIHLLRADLEHLPKVILLDLRMPRKSGNEILKELKCDSELKRIPVCLFSNADLEDDVRQAYELGASFYFKKPSGLDELHEFVATFTKLWFRFASLCR